MTADVMKVSLALAQIKRSKHFDVRPLVHGLLQALCHAYEAGEALPPVDVFFDGTKYWLADGRHRLAAQKALGREQIEAHVHRGSMRDAFFFGCRINSRHGLTRTNAEMTAAVRAILTDAHLEGLDDSEVALRSMVPIDLVRQLRIAGSLADASAEGAFPGPSSDPDHNQLARETRTLERWRARRVSGSASEVLLLPTPFSEQSKSACGSVTAGELRRFIEGCANETKLQVEQAFEPGIGLSVKIYALSEFRSVEADPTQAVEPAGTTTAGP